MKRMLARFAGPGSNTAIMPEIAHTAAAQEAAEPVKTKGRTAKPAKDSEGNGSIPVATTAAPGSTPEASQSQDTVASTGASATLTETTATPAATSPAEQAASEAGEVTIQHLKDAMADLLKAKSASFAMQTLEAATGCKSLTSGSPSVAEKAQEDPTIFRRTLDALVAAKTAA